MMMKSIRLMSLAVLLGATSGCFLFGSKKSEAEERPVFVVRAAHNDIDTSQPRATLGPVNPPRAAAKVEIHGDMGEMIGRVCTVHVRQAEANPKMATTGILAKVTDEWIVLDSGGTSKWIPRNVVIEMDFQPASSTAPQ
jgi:hypothetical protein